MPLDVQVVSPERVLYEGEADMVVCRPADGDIAFLPGHVPFLGALGIDPLRILLPGGGEVAFAVHGGFVEVSNDHVVVLSDLAEEKGQIDVGRAQAAKARAEDLLGATPTTKRPRPTSGAPTPASASPPSSSSAEAGVPEPVSNRVPAHHDTTRCRWSVAGSPRATLARRGSATWNRGLASTAST